MFGAGKCSNHYSDGMDVFIANTLNKYLPSLCFLSLLVTRILLSFIPTMVPCHCSLHQSSHQHTMMAASISAWDVPITHGRVRSHELSPSSSFLFPTHTLLFISSMQANFVTQNRGGCTRVGYAASKLARWQRTTRTRRWTGMRSVYLIIWPSP